MHTIGQDDVAHTTTAVALCINSPIAWSMTKRQLAVFQQLCNLQMDANGPSSLLPNVMDALLDLACRPWWDAGVAGIPDEPDPSRPDPPSRLPIESDPNPVNREIAYDVSRILATLMCLHPSVEKMMTPRQCAVLRRLRDLQVADAGAGSLLPHVMQSFLDLARQPWWDGDVPTSPANPVRG